MINRGNSVEEMEVNLDELFEIALNKCLNIFKFRDLKPEQRASIHKIVVDREDLLAVLPTGYGKSIIYQIIPKLHEEIYEISHSEKKQFSVVVVSPLEYIRKQQIERLNAIGIKATCIGDTEEHNKEIAEGLYEIVFGSAEQWLSPKWKYHLQNGDIKNIQALVVDEVHTVETWGIGKKGQAAFREAFGRVAELRSFLPKGTPVLGLTATANKDMRRRLVKFLGMHNCSTIVVSPNKTNIRFAVLKADDKFSCFDLLVNLLVKFRECTHMGFEC